MMGLAGHRCQSSGPWGPSILASLPLPPERRHGGVSYGTRGRVSNDPAGSSTVRGWLLGPPATGRSMPRNLTPRAEAGQSETGLLFDEFSAPGRAGGDVRWGSFPPGARTPHPTTRRAGRARLSARREAARPARRRGRARRAPLPRPWRAEAGSRRRGCSRDRAPPLDRPDQRALVAVLQAPTYGQPARDSRDGPRHAVEPFGEIHRRCLPLEGRVRRQDHLRQRLAVARRVVRALEELPDLEALGPDPVDRRDRPVQDVIQASELGRPLER